MAVHFNRIASSWEVKDALALVKLDQDFPLDVVDIGAINYLFGGAEAGLLRSTIRPGIAVSNVFTVGEVCSTWPRQVLY